MTKIQTAREYVDSRPEEKWDSRREFYLYHHTASRFRINVEQSCMPFLGIERADELAEQGISDAEFDATEFAKDFEEMFCDHLSLFDIRILVDHLIDYRDRLEKSHRKSRTEYVDLYGKS